MRRNSLSLQGACRFLDPAAVARSYAVSTCDAAYLWVAGLLRAPLATFDDKLAKAARAYLANLGAA